MVDDLSHEVGEEHSLCNDGEPGEQVTCTQSQQLWRHLQHGEPQQPHGGRDLKRRDMIRQRRPYWKEIEITGFYFLCVRFSCKNSHLSLFALCISAGRVGVPTAVSVSLSAPPPVSGLHLVQVVHAARRLDEKGGVGAAVAVTVAPDSPVVGEGAGRLAVEGVTVA